MAPDAERKIAHRIREAERTEVPWNRDAVWMRVQEESVTRTSDRKYWFYAAAAVLLLLATTYVLFNLPGNTSQEDNLVIAPTPAVPAPKEAKDVEHAVAEVVPQSQHTNALTEVKKKQKNENAIESNKQPLLSDNLEEILPDFEIEDIIVEIPEELPERYTETKPVVKIRPVVGVVIQENSSQTAEISKKRRRLHTLEPVDPLPWEEAPKKALVFARRK